ncbi:hypothetical protein BAUCODRAFT_431212 [Baudoinia panamericana UAMH 10762]|uniref:Proteophosphoglycan 5 n=1 Tax=Baudoinia panamericana (strain UAMH 10762) TaxID=717646 RepID=M2NCI0_BAUPA|nr:uncharacterized protein BAUCODRAFT_431212 [Baudoinia panamericana UAMH 10762]EMC96889.1 hypothetical protein BAUCODRAFT_431212 [Baudoinia panamericana UAMH 10762]
MAATANDQPLPSADGSLSKSDLTAIKASQHGEKRAKPQSRTRKPKPSSHQPSDGTVSDSVTNPLTSAGAKKPAQQGQSVANPTAPKPNGYMGRANGQKTRPVSLGGPLLPATPAKEQAYAGPTFHASPAASALPIPKFFSRSVPGDANPFAARMAGEEKTPEQQSSPEPDVVEPEALRETQQSPLDLFFKADKEERSRSSSGMLSPEMAQRKPAPATEPRNPFQQHQSGKSVFLQELDGNNEPMPSPRTVPNGARPDTLERAHSSPGLRPQSAGDQDDRQTYTQSLKDLLFNNVNKPPTTSTNTTPPQVSHERAYSAAQATQTPSPYHRSSSGPTTPAPVPSSAGQPNHYALHYGNRNLSPLFKAARGPDTPTRPSTLRQELPNGDNISSAFPRPPPPSQSNDPADPNTFPRDYLNQQIRDYRPASLPQLPFTNGSRPGASGNASTSESTAANGAMLPSNASPRAGATGGSSSRDIRSMEDDLRRMLKLNVLG